jgi:hypothetical protein
LIYYYIISIRAAVVKPLANKFFNWKKNVNKFIIIQGNVKMFGGDG